MAPEQHGDHRKSGRPYVRLLGMAVVHFLAMFVLMYAMVDSTGDVFPNNNQVYMAALMTSPMLLIELWLMGGMYPSKALNVGVALAGLAILAGSFLFIRQQAFVSDRQFLRSMIPHHSAAILMCEQASIRDPQIKALCGGIGESQSAEIAWMKSKLRAMDQGRATQVPAPPARPAPGR